METVLKSRFRTAKAAIDNQGGFSTLEIVITLVFLAVVLPALILLFTSAGIQSAASLIETKAILLCNEKMEEISADKLSTSRGYAWVTTPNRYASESLSGGFTRSVVIVTGKSFSGVSYTEVTVTVTQSAIPTVQVKNWLTQY